MIKRLIACLLLCLPLAAQNRRVDGVAFSRSGLPAPGASIAICSQTAITAASETGNIVTITSALNPGIGTTVTIFDVVPSGYNGTWSVLSSSGTQFTYFNPLTGIGAGSSFGATITSGFFACSTPVALCSTPSDGACVSPNPLIADGLGNYSFYLQPNVCTVSAPCALQIFGSAITTRVQPDQSYGAAASSPTPPGSGLASPGSALPIRFTYHFGRGDGILAYGHGVGAVGTQGNFSPTATETSGRTVSSSAVGSTNTVISTCGGMGGNAGQDFLSFGTISRFTARLETQTVATARYWIGIFDLGAGECTSGNSTYASDAPNRNYCAFRFSTTTDTTWKAVCATSNVAQTVVDTGVTPVTASSTTFEVFPGTSSTTFYINGTLVATVSSNLPVASSPVSFGFQGDNKNTATAETVVFFWDQLLESK